MNVNLLIDAIVRQTTVLIAELATNRGLRAPLAHVAEQVFFELTRELDAQGISRKVSADMFGMALRTYQRSTTDTPPSQELVWALVSPRARHLDELASLGRFSAAQLEDELEQLVATGRVECADGDVVRFRARHFFVSLGTPTGEAPCSTISTPSSAPSAASSAAARTRRHGRGRR